MDEDYQLQNVAHILNVKVTSTLASKVDFLEKVDRMLTFTRFIVEFGDAAGEVIYMSEN